MRQLIEDLISAMEYHVEQTRPIHSTTVALQAARQALKAQPAPVQSCYCPNCESMGKELAALKAQKAHVPDLTHDQWDEWQDKHGLILERDALDDLRSMLATPPAAQPAVPDAFGTREGEHPQYIQGWNDCRAEMLKGMKP